MSYKSGPKSDSEDGNYIKKDEETKSENKSEDNKKSASEKLKDELRKLKKILTNIMPTNRKQRNLEDEIGGTEVNYEKEKKAADEDVDVWDKKNVKELPPAKEGDDFDHEANKSFIHSKKRRKGGKLGAMILNPDSPIKGETKHKKGKDDHEGPHESKLSMVLRFTKPNNENDRGAGGLGR